MRLVGDDGVKAWMGMQQIAAAAVRIDGFIFLMCLRFDGLTLLCCGSLMGLQSTVEEKKSY
jgi:hypothetical protein